MKHLIFLSNFLFLLSFSTSGQTPLKAWDKRFGGSNDDKLYSLQQTADGGYILGGHSSSGIGNDKTENSRGGRDYWMVKTDATGNKLWDKRFGGTGDENFWVIKQTTDGGYILGGHTASLATGDKTQTSQGGTDYWIVKTDASGIKQWDKRFGGSGNEVLYALQQTSDGGYILGGYSFSGISGDKTQANWGNEDYWIVKIDASGTKQWDKAFGSVFSEQLSALQQTSDGGYILGGITLAGLSGDVSQSGRGNADYWILKTDAAGNKLWDKRFGGSQSDVLQSLQQTSDGGYILGGRSRSPISGDKTEATLGDDDYWMVKTDAAGNFQWDKNFGTNTYDFLFYVQQTTDGGYLAGGYTTAGINGDKTEPGWGGGDFWIVKTNASGAKQWDKRYGGSLDEISPAMTQTTDGGYVLGGYSNSDISGDKSQSAYSTNFTDFWIIKLNVPQPPATPVITASGPTTFCAGDSVTLTANSATAGVTYSWFFNGVVISGVTSSTYTASDAGSYTVVALTSAGGSSTPTALVISVIPKPATPLITQSGFVLSSSNSMGNQWYLNGNAIPNATNQTYNVTSNGSYTVISTVNGCSSDISTAVNIINTGLLPELPSQNLEIFPNPSNGYFIIKLTDQKQEVVITLYNTIGQPVLVEKLPAGLSGKSLDISNLAKGIYIIKITSPKEISQARLVVQ